MLLNILHSHCNFSVHRKFLKKYRWKRATKVLRNFSIPWVMILLRMWKAIIYRWITTISLYFLCGYWILNTLKLYRFLFPCFYFSMNFLEYFLCDFQPFFKTFGSMSTCSFLCLFFVLFPSTYTHVLLFFHISDSLLISWTFKF